jgi:Ca-activated chloride channel family protein
MNANRSFNYLLILVVILSLLLGACAPAAQTVEVVKTVSIEKETLRTYEVSGEGLPVVGQSAPNADSLEAPRATTPTLAPFATNVPAGEIKNIAPEISAPVFPTPPVGNEFQNYGVNPYIAAVEDHLSTFALDVDTASYTVMRRYLKDGMLPPAESVRVEEYVNYFDPGYPTPPDVAFAIYADGAPSPFSTDGSILLRIGVQGYAVSDAQRKPSVLTFVVDISGSMAINGRLELVKQSLTMLVERLRPDDVVAIVVYGSEARTVLDPTPASNHGDILNAIYSLQTEGATNAEAGLLLGYEHAMRAFNPSANNRVILCSDGVANVGATGPDQILSRVRGYVEEGVYLTTIGVGMGNFNDVLLEQLANDGNGTYAYIDDQDEAKRLFVDNLTSTLQVIALDSKIQVDFNPEIVAYYRLLGYENRDVADEDFRNDAVDAGEIGAGHSATAIYSIVLNPRAEGRIATVQLRWQDPDTMRVTEINGNVNTWDMADSFYRTAPHYQLAVLVAQYAEVLRRSPWAGGISLNQLANLAAEISYSLPADDDVSEFVKLLQQAAQINR